MQNAVWGGKIMDCNNCNWKNPDTCKACKARSKVLFVGKAKDMTKEEITKSWYYGRKVESLEGVDFARN